MVVCVVMFVVCVSFLVGSVCLLSNVVSMVVCVGLVIRKVVLEKLFGCDMLGFLLCGYFRELCVVMF